MPVFVHDGIHFHYRDEGAGLPFVFQHGLGGDVNQPFGFFEDLLKPAPPFRLIALDCRAHGETRPLGPESKICLASYADDVIALMDALGLEGAIVGGISMGAAVALNLVLRYPARVRGLVLSRPAWLDAPLPENLTILTRVAEYIRTYGAGEGRDRFIQSEDYTRAFAESPDVAKSLISQFEHPRAEETAVKLERIPRDAPGTDRGEWSHINVPALVLANRQDPIHPFAFGAILAAAIPGAEFQELTPKSVSISGHTRDVQRHILNFIRRLP